MKINEWYVSRYSIRTNRYGFVNLLQLGDKWRVSFDKMYEVQSAFDGSTSRHRLFDTAEEAQRAVDAFKFDGICWHFNPDSMFYEGVIGGYVFVVALTENLYHKQTWEVTECDCQDFIDWLTDSEYVFTEEEREGLESSWSNPVSAKTAVVELWKEYQVFCNEHRSYDDYTDKFFEAVK
jgi:hypothetical protein